MAAAEKVRLSSVFLPGASFVVNGAAPAHEAALTNTLMPRLLSAQTTRTQRVFNPGPFQKLSFS